ncbi:MAG: aminoacyl-tRNA hydrolase, partial [Nanoarchaeota archaeon]
KKVILKVKDEKELLNFKKLADKYKLVNALIKDAGRTEIPSGTITCLAIGPDEDEKIDKITGKLKIL